MSKKGATYSASSDRHAEHKHLFGSGGNSDFILNMTAEGTQKLCGIYCMIAMLLTAVSAIPYYIAKLIGGDSSYMLLQNELNQKLIFLVMTFMVAAGFLGLLVFMIACVKKEVVIGQNKAMLIFVGILISALVSSLASEDVGTAIFGYLDRAEGLITLIGYIGFFAIGASITSELYRRRAANTMVIIGTANAVMGILQSIPALAKWIPSYYNYLFVGYKTDVDMAEYFNTYAGYDASYAADGFCCSPFALGALLTIACALAVNNAAYGKGKIFRLLNTAAAGVMSAAAILTQTFPAMLGIACVLVIAAVLAIVNSAKEDAEQDKKYGKSPVFAVVLCAVIAGGIFAGVCLTDNFRMRNERVMFTDSFERLSISYDAHSEKSEGIYPTLWYEGWLCFTNHALLGVGPDNWATMYNGGEGMEIDRTYNEYLDTALTRGVVGAALYIAMLVITLMKALRMVKSAIKSEDKTALGIFTAFAAYAVQAFFNISTASSTPFFYLMIGLIWSYEAKGIIQAKASKKK